VNTVPTSAPATRPDQPLTSEQADEIMRLAMASIAAACRDAIVFAQLGTSTDGTTPDEYRAASTAAFTALCQYVYGLSR